MKIGILDGYRKPRHKRRRSTKRRFRGLSPAMKRNQAKMKKCAVKWKRSGKHGKYTSFISKCMRA